MVDSKKMREIIVTGAHRSGTSAISTFLSNLGVNLGDPEMLLGAAKDNEKGFFERQDVMDINDDILSYLDSSWDNFNLKSLQNLKTDKIPEEIQKNIRIVLESLRRENRSFLLKDPRFSLTLPVWRKFLDNPLIIICLRNPLEISRSLQRRNGFSVYKSLAVWETYLWSLHFRANFKDYLYVDFNSLLRDPALYGSRLYDQLSELGIFFTSSVEDAVKKSFDSNLIHEECREAEVEALLSVRQMALWKAVQSGDGLQRFFNRYITFDVVEPLRQKNTDIGYSQLLIQLFWDIGKGYNEEDSSTLFIGQNYRYTFDLNGINLEYFRLDPLNIPCIVNSLKVSCVFSEGTTDMVESTNHNGHFDPDTKKYYFPHNDSNIFFKVSSPGIVQVQIDIAFSSLDDAVISKELIEYLGQKTLTAEDRLAVIVDEKKKLLNILEEKIAQNSSSSLQRALKYIRSMVCFAKLIKEPKNLRASLRYIWLLHKERSLFSPEYYLDQNKDIDPLMVSPLVHFLAFGWQEGRNPSKDFDVNYFLSVYKDIAEQDVNPLLQYIEKGWLEGRNPSSSFSTNRYIARHPSCLAENTNPLLHKSRQCEGTPDERTERERILFDVNPKNLKKPVAIIIPIYLANTRGAEVLLCLLETIQNSYPRLNKKLSFTLIDDGSPEECFKTVASKTRFLDREDVTCIENSVNQGFVKTVNLGLKHVASGADVVLLNSDTEIHGAVFEILQHACYRSPNTASVTPLSNRATIASLTNWPFGEDMIYDLSPAEISEVVENAGLVGGQNNTPTGHGFCLYLSRAALNDIGGLDDITFLHGYGEENDWSMRAIKAGYEHTICTECFVFHHESMSFSTVEKETLKQQNSRKLLSKHPYYDEMVSLHLSDNHLNRYRKILLLLILEKKKEQSNLRSLCFVIHDSFKNYQGGVQQHLRQLIDGMFNSGCNFELFVVSPDKICGTAYEIFFAQKNEHLEITNLDKETLIQVMQRLEMRLDILHIHHTFCLEEVIVDWLKNCKIPEKIFTIHDYDLFCSNPFLLNDQGKFCLATEERGYCSNKTCCEKGNDTSILEVVDKIYVPSENCYKYTSQLLEQKGTSRKIEVLPHFLSFTDFTVTESGKEENSKRVSKNVVFLGALYPHKGGDCFLDCADKITALGFQPSIWGHTQEKLISRYASIPPVLPFRNWRELLELFNIYGVHIAVMPACCPETFSYTLYEALFLLGVPVIVGPYGNPADVVNRNRVGEVLSDNSDSSLLDAINKISGNYDEYLKSIDQYTKRTIRSFSRAEYLKKYIGSVLGTTYQGEPEADHDALRSFPVLTQQAQDMMSQTLNDSKVKPVRVLIVHALSKFDPPYFYRVENPVHYLNKMGCYVDIVSLEDIPVSSDQYDLIYLSRTPMTEKLDVLLQSASVRKVTSVLDVDDLVFHQDFLQYFYFLEPSSSASAEYEKLLTGIEKTFNRVDLLLASTPTIASVAQRYGKLSFYHRNMLRANYQALYKKLYSNRPPYKEQLIGYFSGSNTHDRDFNMIIPVLEKLFSENSEVKLLAMGFVQDIDFFQKYSDRVILQEFDTYENYLQSLQCCKVVVLPIAEVNDFSNAKSGIKYLEAAAVGTPMVSSPIIEMVNIIEHGVTGWIASNQEEWISNLSVALSGDYSMQIGSRANESVMHQYKQSEKAFSGLIKAISKLDKS